MVGMAQDITMGLTIQIIQPIMLGDAAMATMAAHFITEELIIMDTITVTGTTKNWI